MITSNLHQLKAFGSGFQANAARRMRRTKLRSFKLGRVLKNATGGDGRRNIAAGPAAFCWHSWGRILACHAPPLFTGFFLNPYKVDLP